MSEDGFLGRWSRLKRGGAEPPGAESAADADPEAGAALPADDAPMTEAEIAALPPVETIATPQDLAAFLRRGAPPLLRQAALRRMWRITPAIRDYVDDAREYAFDWNAPGGAPGGGMLSQDAAAKLLARLFDATPATLATPAAAQGAAEAPAAVASAAPDPGRPPEAMRIAAEADGAGGETVDPVPAPQRRHGGATPV